MSDDWVAVLSDGDLPEDGTHKIILNGWHILLTRTDEGLFAINDRCTHQASLLSTGRIRRGAIMCPLHGARFDVASGKCLGGTYRDLRIYGVRVLHGMIEVELPDREPGIEDIPVTF